MMSCMIHLAHVHVHVHILRLEAVASGCYPLCPNRLVYPEFYPGRIKLSDDALFIADFVVKDFAMVKLFSLQKSVCTIRNISYSRG